MIQLIGGDLYQWDLGRSVEYMPEDGNDISELHFANPGDAKASVIEVTATDGVYTAKIPNILLQSGKPVCVWAVCAVEGSRHNAEQSILHVRKRERPADYVYTETEVMYWKALEARINDLEENGIGGIVNESDPTVPAWAKQPQKPTYTAEEVGALPSHTYIPTGTLIVTVTNGVASDSPADIVDFVQNGGNAMIHYGITYMPLLCVDEQGSYYAIFGYVDDAGMIRTVIVDEQCNIAVYDYNYAEVDDIPTEAEIEEIIRNSQAVSEVVRQYLPDYAYSKGETEDLINEKLESFEVTDSTIHIGADEPTDNSNLWIDTDDESSGVTDEYINSLIDAKLGVIENGSY